LPPKDEVIKTRWKTFKEDFKNWINTAVSSYENYFVEHGSDICVDFNFGGICLLFSGFLLEL